MDLGLKGKSVLITGASQGIGEGLAKGFAAEGADLQLTARNAEKLARIKSDIEANFPVSVRTHPLDLTAAGACEALVERCGGVDILINNAGVIPGGSLFDIDAKAWRDGWQLKVFGYIDLTRLIYREMKARGGGVIINNIGNAGESYDVDYIAGTSGNASLMAFTRTLGGRSLDDNIRVLGINPGPVDTDRIYKLLKRRAKNQLGDESRYGELLQRYPLQRPAHVREVVDLFVFLASGRSSYTSGAIFTVDGGIASRGSIV
jgi:NAD(P)-dependent dehydrogenase (short-subunit alcohol dehydrogenase family)